MDPYSSPYIIPNNGPHNPFPHPPLRTRQRWMVLDLMDGGSWAETDSQLGTARVHEGSFALGHTTVSFSSYSPIFISD